MQGSLLQQSLAFRVKEDRVIGNLKNTCQFMTHDDKRDPLGFPSSSLIRSSNLRDDGGSSPAEKVRRKTRFQDQYALAKPARFFIPPLNQRIKFLVAGKSSSKFILQRLRFPTQTTRCRFRAGETDSQTNSSNSKEHP